MTVDDYKFVLSQLSSATWGNVFQVAIGGGEPLEHPDFLDILGASLRAGVTPNVTTNGMLVSSSVASLLRDRVGAMAISVSDMANYPKTAIGHLVSAGVRTNIHFLLRRSTVLQAIDILNGLFDNLLAGVNAVIFLTHKAKGRAISSDNLAWNGDLGRFVRAVDARRTTVKVGFDACLVPLLLHSTRVDTQLIDSCECGFFSVYIDEMLNVSPCSFSTGSKYSWNLRSMSFEHIWQKELGQYRAEIHNDCQRKCPAHAACRGQCPFFPDLTLCYSTSEGATLS